MSTRMSARASNDLEPNIHGERVIRPLYRGLATVERRPAHRDAQL